MPPEPQHARREHQVARGAAPHGAERPGLRARIVGLFEITLVGGMAAGSIVGGYLWKYFGTPIEGIPLVSPAFSINGLIYLISLAVFVWGLKDIKRRLSETEIAGCARAADAPSAVVITSAQIVRMPKCESWIAPSRWQARRSVILWHSRRAIEWIAELATHREAVRAGLTRPS